MKSRLYFYLQVWARWVAAFIAIAASVALVFATLLTIIFYVLKGFAPLDDAEVLTALWTIWTFWLSIGYGIGMISALGIGLYFVFDRCIGTQAIILLNCKKEPVEGPRSRHYFKVWRKWFFAIIWINAFEAIVLMGIHHLIWGGALWMGWFQPFWMLPMILIAGFFSIVIMLSRCTFLKVDRCE